MAETLQENSPAIQAHLTIQQSIIQRMAANSASCKAWCITLVSAILVLVADKNKPQYASIAIIPTLLFLFLDTYYLALERMFRRSYNSFIDKLHAGEIRASDVYLMSPRGNLWANIGSSVFSMSIWPFYATLLAMVIITKKVVM